MFSPPLAADTLLPIRDRACWEIAQLLKQKLNADYAAISHELEAPILGNEPVVVGIADYNAWTNNFQDFPFLAVYRTSSEGDCLEICNAVVAYYLPTMAMQDEVPGILRWVQTRIVRALGANNGFFGGQTDLLHANIPEQRFRCEEGIGVLPGTEVSAFPFFRIIFQFQEIGV